MTVSLAGLIGALFGAVIGVMDFGMIAGFLRRAWDERGAVGGRIAARREAFLKVAFAVNLAVFAGLGYWFGATMAG